MKAAAPSGLRWKPASRYIERRNDPAAAGISGDVRAARGVHQAKPPVAVLRVEHHRNQDDETGAVFGRQRLHPRDAAGRHALDFVGEERPQICDAREVHQPSKIRHQAAEQEVSDLGSHAPELARSREHEVRRLRGVQTEIAGGGR